MGKKREKERKKAKIREKKWEKRAKWGKLEKKMGEKEKKQKNDTKKRAWELPMSVRPTFYQLSQSLSFPKPFTLPGRGDSLRI
jgi:asparagine synthetase B (glutamine-hydrolysing)